MSAQWSLTYLKTEASLREVFDSVVAAFHAEIDDKLYDIEYQQEEKYIDVKLARAVVEEFHHPIRAKLILDSCHLEWLNRGVLVFPQKNGLYPLTDSIITLGDVYESGRTRRHELAEELAGKMDNWQASLFLFMNFLTRLTKSLDAQAAHILFERNPAGWGTGVHFYDAGQFVDDYFVENIEAIGEFGNIDLPQKPDQVRDLLEGRFSFVLGLPKMVQYDKSAPYEEKYFHGEDLSPHHDPKWDIHNVRASQLYMPLWDESSQPFGAVYCPVKALPDYFLARYIQ